MEATGKFVLRPDAPARVRLVIESARRVSPLSANGSEIASVELTLELTSPSGQ